MSLNDRPQRYKVNRRGTARGRKRLCKKRENWYGVYMKMPPSKGGGWGIRMSAAEAELLFKDPFAHYSFEGATE